MDVFFYGLFMDERILTQQGLSPANARFATLKGYRLRIAQRANLIEDKKAMACGVVIDLPPDHVLELYSKPSVSDYQPISVCVELEDASELPAICYLLPPDKSNQGSNTEYAKKLYQLAKELRFPDKYLSEIQLVSDANTRLDE